MRVLFIGGDARYVHLLRMTSARGHDVCAVGMDKADILPDKRTAALDGVTCDAMVLPMPYRDAAGHVPAPFAKVPLPFDFVQPHIPGGITLFCGGADGYLREQAEARGFTVRDVFAEDSFAISNAVPSAEGAIYAAMRMLPVTISGSRCLIVGYGRLGRVLGALLLALHAHVTVAARSESARAKARADGLHAISTAKLPLALLNMRAIFNTVPCILLNDDALAYADPHAVLIELAGPPYGIDAKAAKRRGLNYALESGIPGRYSPETAAEILLHTIWGEDA